MSLVYSVLDGNSYIYFFHIEQLIFLFYSEIYLSRKYLHADLEAFSLGYEPDFYLL